MTTTIMDYMTLGPTPYDEPCAQVGAADYYERSKRECAVYLHQLERTFPIPEALNGDVWFAVKTFAHDFGSYREVIVRFNDGNPDAVAFALAVEGDLPGKWDKQSLSELERATLRAADAQAMQRLTL